MASETLTRGDRYNTDDMELIGWTDGDGTGSEGYSIWDYFHADGEYRGPDQHGIEPIVKGSRSMTITEKIENAIQWELRDWTSGQTPYQAGNSAATQETVGEWWLMCNTIRDEAELGEELPTIHEWEGEHGHCLAQLQHVCQGSRVDRLLCTYRVDVAI